MSKYVLAGALVAGLMAGNIALGQEEGAATETKKAPAKKEMKHDMKKHGDHMKKDHGAKKEKGSAEAPPAEGQE